MAGIKGIWLLLKSNRELAIFTGITLLAAFCFGLFLSLAGADELRRTVLPAALFELFPLTYIILKTEPACPTGSYGLGKVYDNKFMEQDIVRSRLLSLKDLQPRFRSAISDNSTINISLITKGRVLSLYELRRQGNIQDEAYAEVNLQIQKMLLALKSHDEELLRMIIITSSKIYAIIFTDEQVHQVMGALDLTGLGNTRDFGV